MWNNLVLMNQENPSLQNCYISFNTLNIHGYISVNFLKARYEVNFLQRTSAKMKLTKYEL